jgi:hypothetical protein
MIETGQIIFLVWAIIAVGALAAAPSWWTAILLVGVLGAWAFNEIRKKGQRKYSGRPRRRAEES